MAAYRNGVRIDPEEFDRVSEEERTAAMQKYHKQRLRDSGTGAVQGGGNLSFGTPEGRHRRRPSRRRISSRIG